MHVKPIRSAAPPASPSRLWPAYNLFRCKRSLGLFCAVPEDYPVPAFVDGHGWEFAGKVEELSAAPLGFERQQQGLSYHLQAFICLGHSKPCGRARTFNTSGGLPEHTRWRQAREGAVVAKAREYTSVPEGLTKWISVPLTQKPGRLSAARVRQRPTIARSGRAINWNTLATRQLERTSASKLLSLVGGRGWGPSSLLGDLARTSRREQ